MGTNFDWENKVRNPQVKEVFEDIDDAMTTMETSLESDIAAVVSVFTGQVTLNGGNPTPVNFQDDDAGYVETDEGPFDFSGVGDGGTIIATPDGGSAQTATLNAAAGYLTGGDAGTENITGETDDSFAISVDGDAFEDVSLTLANCDTGANTAAEMQTKIRALGGNKASVTVAWSTDHYVITSPTLGTNSAVAVQAPSEGGSLLEELDLGDNAVATAGTGDCGDITAVTVDELVTLCNGDMTGITASNEGGKLRLTSDTTGKDSSVVVGAGTLNTTLGIAENDAGYGAQGLGLDGDMADAEYIVLPVLTGASTVSARGISVNSKATSGFELKCETDAATDDVDLVIHGTLA